MTPKKITLLFVIRDKVMKCCSACRFFLFFFSGLLLIGSAERVYRILIIKPYMWPKKNLEMMSSR